ncbi:unnamed protein product (macronuclear) [Paramecium tetraurelia]|uniref:Palmitoyltransferase n=1 Tax=Paramecium tetraurelia TaxID=5888 RepID=A0CEV6_PARTE|nr:uncharacterized protein GSPATT00037762001 [Paramecium tetraurelia]CAK69323.1 unnamed protein product [Paramecium tetraurelia]|eukprot:XP_001436720.1 hypothetical protein (macronuclear) [Paramecium tetraurelia strain d4-2]
MKARSGCSQFPTLFQISTYILFILNAVLIFIHTFALEENIVHYIIFSFLVWISIYFCIKTTISDPTDSFVIQQQNNRGEFFDYEDQQLNQFCELCFAYVKDTTKHCKSCDRCCEDFDHHCRWINNCIGGKNYKPFIGMIVSVFLLLLYSIVVNGRVINQYHEEELQTSTFYSKHAQLILIITVIFLVLEIVGFVFLLQLIALHAYIYKKGMTTYDFIVSRRKKKVEPSNQSEINRDNNQENKIKNIKDSKEQDNKPVIQKKEDGKQGSKTYTHPEIIKNEGSLCSSKKAKQTVLQKRKLTQDGSDEYQKESFVNFFTQRHQTNIEFQLQNRKTNNIEATTPELAKLQ